MRVGGADAAEEATDTAAQWEVTCQGVHVNLKAST